MAKFIAGPVASEIRGSLGGTTFTRNRYGAIMRQRVKPTVSTTEYATTAKARMTAATQAWQGLTAAQKLAWNEWAAGNPSLGALGEQQILTGHVAYVGSYCRALTAGIPVLTAPPAAAAPAPLTSLVVSADIGAGNVELTYTPTPIGATEYLWVRACVVTSSGINYVSNLLRFIVRSGAAQASPYDIEAALAARVGAPQVGQTLHVFATIFDAGTMLMSAPLRDSAVVVTT